MQLSKNKKYQYLFFSILSIFIIFNGGNSNLFIQFNFILISLFFLFCLKDKNYNLHLKYFYINNKKSIFLYIIFLIYLSFQIIPLPINVLKFFSPEKYKLILMIGDSSFSSISLSPSNSFFQIFHFLTILLIVFILKMVFHTERHKYRLYFFLSIFGFAASIIAVLFYLNGNPDFFIIKNSYYKNASSGFFINRTVLAIFLLFCLISSLELLKNFEFNKKQKEDQFFKKIYIRLFILFITIGIITSFSRIGNFLLLITILIYFLNELFFSKNKNQSFKIIILFIILFDLLFVGIYFGTSEIIDRFSFLREEFSYIPSDVISISRFDIIKFAFSELKNFILFGYGSGSFESLFQLKFINSSSQFANHAHSDLVEFFGEFGLVGITFIILSIIKFFLNKENYTLINLIVLSYAIILLYFDFSLHIPVIQILFVMFFILNKKSITSNVSI